jgi:predicted XRE-type DNA-binding protein
VYGLFDPKKDFPFYIGKGTKNRMKEHLRENYSHDNPHKRRKIEKIRRRGKEPYARKLYENLTEDKAYMREWCLINLYYDKLTNIDNSYGVGFGCKEEHPYYEKSLSKEHRKKIAKSRKGQTLSEKTKKKIGNSLRGRSLSEEHTEKLTGREFNEQHKKNISEAKKGEKNPSAKLTSNQAAEVKWLLKNTNMFQKEIAQKYNVDPSNISHISRNKSWKTVTSKKP